MRLLTGLFICIPGSRFNFLIPEAFEITTDADNIKENTPQHI